MGVISEIESADRDVALVASSLVEQFVGVQRVVGGHLTDLNARIVQERAGVVRDGPTIRAMVELRDAVVDAHAALRNARLDFVRNVTALREKLTGRILPS